MSIPAHVYTFSPSIIGTSTQGYDYDCDYVNQLNFVTLEHKHRLEPLPLRVGGEAGPTLNLQSDRHHDAFSALRLQLPSKVL